MKPIPISRNIRTLAIDTTEHCNARCLFCFNDWSKHQPANMKPEEVNRILPLLHRVEDEGFYLSCLFEPTLNPDFFAILEALPAYAKPKTFFTTNLVRPLSDEEIKILCKANVDHINISLETFDPDLYVKLTSVKKTAFFDNLARLGEMSQKYGTKIRLITMIMKDNYAELPSLVKKAHDLVHPWQHELRTPIYTKGDPAREKATEDELLSAAELEKIKQELESLGYNLVFDTKWNRDFYMNWKQKELQREKEKGRKRSDLPEYVVRLYAGGNGVIEDLDETFNWRKTRNLEKFIAKRLSKTKKLEGKIIQQNFIKTIPDE